MKDVPSDTLYLTVCPIMARKCPGQNTVVQAELTGLRVKQALDFVETRVSSVLLLRTVLHQR